MLQLVQRRLLLASAACALASAPLCAQSFNVDIGLDFGAPFDAYGAAASQPGRWNELDMTGTTFTPNALLDLSGAAATATIEFNKAGAGNLSFDNLLTTGNDESLLDDFNDIGSLTNSKVKYTFAGLLPGDYDVYVYSWAPDQPLNYVSNVEVIGGANGIQACGGNDWTGAHVLGETYVMDTYTSIAGEVIVRITTNAGFATCNGIQIVYAGTGCASNAVNYCTAGTSANGCQAAMSSVGSASVSAAVGFTVMASGVEGAKDGLFFYGQVGRQANSWGNGTSLQCVTTPVKRGGLLTGSGNAGQCDGTFAQDLNARWCPACTHPNHNPVAGQKMQLQLWYRDPFNTSNQTTSLSDALEVDVCP
jgi:hypothetical protein